MRLLTWNINGYRAILKKGLEDILGMLDLSVACFQEIKAMPDQIEMDPYLFDQVFINSAERKGYSGTMIASILKPEKVTYGMGIEELDKEGRVLTAYFDGFAVVTVYTPNAQDGLKRIEFREKWDKAFGQYCRSLGVPALICGDFNVARTALDIFSEDAGIGGPGYSDQEREGFETQLMPYFKDVFRELHPQKRQYTWWSYYSRGRERNQGWRIDYWLASPELMPYIRDISILDDIYGSDHCPVLLDFDERKFRKDRKEQEQKEQA